LASALRFYLTGGVAIEGSRTFDQGALVGRQGRLALVYLLVERHRPVPIDELATALWGDALPRSWESSLRVVVSKLRTVLTHAGNPETTIVTEGGCYRVRLGDAWVDIEVAANAVDRAEGAWRNGDVAATWSEATVAAGIVRRPLLPGEEQPWVSSLRTRLHDMGVRATDLLVQVYLARGEHSLAIAVGRDLVALEPFREASYRHLMRAHLAAGDRAEAVRTHQQLRDLLSEELGVAPSTETTALYLDVLRTGTQN
jgi:DNA-binding SARP family transcriptional activator